MPFAGELLGVGGRLRRSSSETPLDVALQELAACGFAVSQRTRLRNVTRFDRLAVTSRISGTSYDVQTFVVWAEGMGADYSLSLCPEAYALTLDRADNRSTLNPDISFINFQLTEKRRRRERLIASGAFQNLSQHEQLQWSPRIVSLRWWPIEEALQVLHPSSPHINDYQRAEFARLAHSGRDVAVGTSHALRHLRDIGSLAAFKERYAPPQHTARGPMLLELGASQHTRGTFAARRSRSWDSHLGAAFGSEQPSLPAPQSQATSRATKAPQTAKTSDTIESPRPAQRARSGTVGLLPTPLWFPSSTFSAAAHTTPAPDNANGTAELIQDAPMSPDIFTPLPTAEKAGVQLPLVPSSRVYSQSVCAGRRLHEQQPQPEANLSAPMNTNDRAPSLPSEPHLTILSYNLNALPVGASMVSSHSSNYTGERINAFVAHLADLHEQRRSPHVLALQEVFASPISPLVCFQAALLRRLDDLGFSYVARMPRPSAYDVLAHGKYTDSGLLIVSQLPITASDFHAFSTAGSGLDAGAAKGVVWARVALSAVRHSASSTTGNDPIMQSSSRELMVDIFNCHLQASHTSAGAYTAVREAQMQEMLAFIKLRTHNSPFPFMLMGDFNVDGVAEQPGEHIGLPYFSARVGLKVEPAGSSSAHSGLTDSAEYCRLYQQLQGAITRMPLAAGSFSSNAPLGAMVDVLKQRHGRQISTRPPRQQYPRSIQYAYVHKYPQRLDYLWYAEGEAGQLVADIQSVQVHPFRVSGAPFRYLSDHYGLSVRLVQDKLDNWMDAAEPVVIPPVSPDSEGSAGDTMPVTLPLPPPAHSMRRSQSCAGFLTPTINPLLHLSTPSAGSGSPQATLPARSDEVLRLVRDPPPDSWLSSAIYAASPWYWSYLSLFAYRSRAWAILHRISATVIVLVAVALTARVTVALLPCQAEYLQAINDSVFIPVQQVCIAAQHTVAFPEKAWLRAHEVSWAFRKTHLPRFSLGVTTLLSQLMQTTWDYSIVASAYIPGVLAALGVLLLSVLVFAFDWTVHNAWSSFVHAAVHGAHFPQGFFSSVQLRALQVIQGVRGAHLPHKLARAAEGALLRLLHRLLASRGTAERLYNLAVVPAQAKTKEHAKWLFVTFVGRRPLSGAHGAHAPKPALAVPAPIASPPAHSKHTGEFFLDDSRSVSSHQHIMDSPVAFHAVVPASRGRASPKPRASSSAEFLLETTKQYLLWAGVHRPVSTRITRKRGAKHETWKMHVFQLFEELSDVTVLPVLRWALDSGSAAAVYGTRRSAERFVTEFTTDSSIASQRSVRLLRMRSQPRRHKHAALTAGGAQLPPGAVPQGAGDAVDSFTQGIVPLPAAGGAVPNYTRQYAMLALLQAATPCPPPIMPILLAAQRSRSAGAMPVSTIRQGASLGKLAFFPNTASALTEAAQDAAPDTLYASLLSGARQHGTRRAMGWLAEDEPTFLGAFSSVEVNGMSWWSYTDLVALASCFGAGLVRLGRLKPGSKVGILAVESREWLLADAACACFGLVSAALHCPSPEGLCALLDAAECDAILCSRRFIHAVVDWCATRVSHSNPFLVQIQPIQYAERMAALELGVPLHTMEFILSAGKAHPLAHSPPLPSDSATEVYSWRSTPAGDLLPVPIVLSHRAIALSIGRFRGSTPGSLVTAADTYLSQLPLPDMAERTMVHACLQVGACIVFGVENTNAVLHQLHVVKPTIMATTPKLMEHLFCHFLRIRRSWSAWYRRVYIESFSEKSVSLFESATAVRSAMRNAHGDTGGAQGDAAGMSTQQDYVLHRHIENVTTLLSPSRRWSDATFFHSSASLLGTASLKMLLVVCTRDSGGFSARPDVRDFAQVAMCTPVVEVFASQRFGVLFTKPINLTPVVPHPGSPLEVAAPCGGATAASSLTSARRSILEQSSRLSVGDLVPGLTALLEPVAGAPGVMRLVIPVSQRTQGTGEVADVLEDFGRPHPSRLRVHPVEAAEADEETLADVTGVVLADDASCEESNKPGLGTHLLTVDTGVLVKEHSSPDGSHGGFVFCGMRDALVPVVQPGVNTAPQLVSLQRLEQIVHCCCGMLQRVWVAMPPAVRSGGAWVQLPPIVVASVFPEQAYSWANECNDAALATAASAAVICSHPTTQSYVLQRVHHAAQLSCVHLSDLERASLASTAGIILLADTLQPPMVTPQGGLNRPALWHSHLHQCRLLYASLCPSFSASSLELALLTACELNGP